MWPSVGPAGPAGCRQTGVSDFTDGPLGRLRASRLPDRGSELGRYLHVPASWPREDALCVAESCQRCIPLNQVALVEQVDDARGDPPAVVDAELERGVADEIAVLLDLGDAAGDEGDVRGVAAVEARGQRVALGQRDFVADREIALERWGERQVVARATVAVAPGTSVIERMSSSSRLMPASSRSPQSGW